MRVPIGERVTKRIKVAIVTFMQATKLSTAGAVPTLNTLGNRARAAREFADLNQTELADLTGLSRTTISRVEAGNHAPANGTIITWAIACGVDSNWMFTGEQAAQ